jgi:arylformamidase
MRHIAGMNAWLDVTVPVHPGMVRWPGDPIVKVSRRLDMARGDDINLSMISMGAHTGTHIDAPGHFLRFGKSIDQMPFSAMVGPARVIEIRDPESIKVVELATHRIRRGERILFRTRNSRRCWRAKHFVKDYVHISREGARFLAARQVAIIGVDYLSVGGFKEEGHEVHLTLLGAGVWLIEGLDLSRVRSGRYDLIALPLKMKGADGAPARVLLRKRA